MKNIDKNKELYNCNFVKFMLMICVVLGHSVHFWTGDWFKIIKPAQSSDTLGYISHFISGFHVYAFAMVSGYIFYYLRIEMNRYPEWKPFVINKIKRLIVPYVFVSVVYLIPVEIFLYGFDLGHLISKFVLVISPSHLWFLWMLFDVFMIAWPISPFLAKIGRGGVLIGLLLYGFGILGSSLLPDVFGIWTACEFFLFFWMGFYLRSRKDSLIYKIPIICYFLVYVALFIIYEMLCDKQDFIIRLALKLVALSMNCVGALMAFFIFQVIASNIRNIKNKLLIFFEKRSMVIYLLHQPIIYFMLLAFNGRVCPYINVLINFCGALFTSVIIGSLLLSWKVTRKCIGE